MKLRNSQKNNHKNPKNELISAPQTNSNNNKGIFNVFVKKSL